MWRDFLYFSKGEKTALILILCLILAGGMISILYHHPFSAPDDPAATGIAHPTPPSDAPQPPAASQPANSQPPVVRTKPKQAAPRQGKETVTERVKRLTSAPHPGRIQKFAPGTVVEMNAADTSELKKIPGIGSAFARRIVKYRNLLGGYYSVAQLREVYGIDEEKYAELEPWFTANASSVRPLFVNALPADSLRKHPYITPRQAYAIERLRKQKKHLTGWENLQLLDEFTEIDKQRLAPYLSFE
jgi:competence ComEA-like helix-hairpin-helix protein